MNLKKWHFTGFIFTVVFGTFLHFAYELSGYNKLMGYFSSVNESVWEHLKLLFWPMFLFSVAEFFCYGKKECDFFLVKLISIFAATGFMIVFFYTYSGILGFSILAVDALIFVLCAFTGQLTSYYLLSKTGGTDKGDNLRGFIILMLMALCFVMWTYNPIPLGIFWG